jgi:3-oxoacyl-[acyl-carrier protein] reductase
MNMDQGMGAGIKGKVAFVTGGAQGIGKEIAELFAKHGANIVVCDINENVLKGTVAELAKHGTGVEGCVLDVRDLNACEEAVKKAVDKFGRIDILVNNAGITRDNLIIRMSEDDFDKVIAINLKGAFNCTKVVSRIMMRQRSGRIVNIASIVGVRGNAGQANYASSKAGLIGLTKSVAQELGSRNVTANAIAPGFIQTEMTHALSEEVKRKMLETIPLRRPGLPSDVAGAALFLASDYAQYITGQVLLVDGGMVM